MLWGGNPRIIGTTYKLCRTNWGEDLRNPTCGYGIFCYLAVFGTVSRILDICDAIFSGHIDISIENMFEISRYLYHAIYRYHALYHDIDTILHVNIHLSQEMTYMFVRVEIKAWNKRISIRTDSRKRLAACVLRMILLIVGCINANQFDARGRQGRKLNSEHFFSFREIKTKASTVVGKGEECVPCDPGYE